MKTHVLLVLLCLAMAPVAAQDAQAPAPAQVATDATGDVMAHGDGTSVPAPGAEHMDLVSATVHESPYAFTFTITTQGAPADAPPGYATTIHWLDLAHAGQGYRVVAIHDAQAGGAVGQLLVLDEGRQEFIHAAAIPVETNGATATLTVARDLLLDPRGAAPFPGRFLGSFQAGAASGLTEGSLDVNGQRVAMPVRIMDRMPDEGASPEVWEVFYGLGQQGGASLSSDDPIRTSNGEATTFVFQVQASNAGPDQMFQFEVADVPSGWDVRPSRDVLTLDAGASQGVLVYVTTPFAHDHGDADTFVLRMVGRDDAAARGQVELGVRYSAVAQPAGHHDTIYIHSEADPSPLRPVAAPVFNGNDGRIFMNTLDEDGDGIPIQGRLRGIETSPGQVGLNLDGSIPPYQWRAFLEPGLQMGLDFDLARQGAILLSLEAGAPMAQAVLEGRIVHLGPGEGAGGVQGYGGRTTTSLAHIEASAPADMLPGTPHVFELAITPTPEADLIPYAKGSALVLELNLTQLRPSGTTGSEAPLLLPGASMRLPLDEYHDRIQAASALGGLHLEVLQDQARMANPGATLVWDAVLENNGPATTVAIRATGVHADWLTIPSEVPMGAGASGTFQAVMHVPEDALDAEVADIILEAATPEAQGVVRLIATVDTDATHPDDAAWVLAPEGRGTPGPGILAGILAVGGAAAGRRRIEDH